MSQCGAATQVACLPRKVEVGLKFIVAATVDAAAAEDVALAPVRPQQDDRDAVDFAAEYLSLQAADAHLTIPHGSLQQ